jgi:RsiW-degrading membrane proteinase PrsW (M82 family)
MFNPTKLVVVGVAVAVIYFLLKFIEMRFAEPENQKPVKVLVRDSIVVCISALLAVFILNQFDNLTSSAGSSSNTGTTPAVFVDTPGF